MWIPLKFFAKIQAMTMLFNHRDERVLKREHRESLLKKTL
jgi:hypothetical protein